MDNVAKSFAEHVAQIAEAKGWQIPLFALNTVKNLSSETVIKPFPNRLEASNTPAKSLQAAPVVSRSEFGTHQLNLKKSKPALERPMDQFARVWDERVAALEPWRESLGNYYRLTICLQTLAQTQHPNARAGAMLPVFIPRGALALALGFSGAMLDQLLGGYYGSSCYYQVKGINQPGRTRKPNLEREQARAAAIAGNAEFRLFKRFVGWHAWTTPVPTNRTKHLNGKPFTNNKHVQTDRKSVV